MSEQPEDANRRVVKKVVKKTVLRPVAPTVPRKAGAPVAKTGESQRTTRLTTPARAQAARAAAPTAPAPAAPVEPPAPVAEPVHSTTAPPAPVRRPAGAPASAPVEPVAPVEEPVPTTPTTAAAPTVAEPAAEPAPSPEAKAAPADKIPGRQPKEKQPRLKKAKQPRVKKDKQPKVKKARRRPSMPSISLPRPDVRGRASDAGHAVGGFFRSLVRTIGGFFSRIGGRVAATWYWLIGLRLPHVSPVRGSAITGVVVGLLAVAMGWGFYQLFSATLGTQAGGGWGFLAFVFLSFVVFIVGELMLAGFGIPFSRIISILAVLLVLLLILVFFLNLAAGLWAFLLVPTLCALMFMAAAFTVITVSQEKNDQRLPWEPTDESQVNTD